jgi:hypothetical protein
MLIRLVTNSRISVTRHVREVVGPEEEGEGGFFLLEGRTIAIHR